jgi:protocatechuate 3,4-dioxygenase beta subunit
LDAQLAQVDFAAEEFKQTCLGRALSEAIRQLGGQIRQSVTAPPQVPQTAETVAPAEQPLAVPAEVEVAPEEVSPEAPAVEPATPAEADAELQQLIADAQAILSSGAGAADQLEVLRQSLEGLQTALAAQASAFEQGDAGAVQAADAQLAEQKSRLQSIVNDIALAQSSPPAEGQEMQPPPAEGPRPDYLAEATRYTDQTIGLIQRIQQLRSLFWNSSQEASQAEAPPAETQSYQETLGEVTGLVLEDGSPVQDAEVTAPEVGANAATGGDGGYSLQGIPTGRVIQLAVTRGGQQVASGQVQVEAGVPAVADFQLTKSPSAGGGESAGAGVLGSMAGGEEGVAGTGGAVQGRLEGPDGRPMVRVPVRLAGVGMVRTNSKGEYTFIKVPPGKRQLTAFPGGKAVQLREIQVASRRSSKANIRLSTLPAAPTAPSAQPMLLQKGSNTSLSGRVRDDKGKPVGNAKVSLTQGTNSLVAPTDDKGKYELLDVLPGKYRAVVSKIGYAGANSEVVLRPGKKEKLDFEIRKTSLMVDRMADKVKSLQGRLSGTVRAKSGGPIQGATVGASMEGSRVPPVQVRTDGQGKYSLKLWAGQYELRVARAGYQTAVQSAAVRAGDSKDVDFSLVQGEGPARGGVSPTLAAGRPAAAAKTPAISRVPLGASGAGGQLKGRVTDTATGKPIAGAAITVDGRSVGTTGQDGNYSVSNLNPGSCLLAAGLPGYRSQQKRVTVESGETLRVNFTLTRDKRGVLPSVASPGEVKPRIPSGVQLQRREAEPGSLRGQVTDAATGKALAGANVSVGGQGSTGVDARGGFYFRNLAPGTYQVTAAGSGYQSQTLSVTIRSGQTATVNFQLRPRLMPRAFPQRR